MENFAAKGSDHEYDLENSGSKSRNLASSHKRRRTTAFKNILNIIQIYKIIYQAIVTMSTRAGLVNRCSYPGGCKQHINGVENKLPHLYIVIMISLFDFRFENDLD